MRKFDEEFEINLATPDHAEAWRKAHAAAQIRARSKSPEDQPWRYKLALLSVAKMCQVNGNIEGDFVFTFQAKE